MKNIYMMQTNIRYPNGTYLPYAAATIAAYALADPAISREFALKEIFCVREDPEAVVASLEAPAVFCFSCYVWNTEYNKEVAALLKKRFPACTVVFGGHNIPEGSTQFLEQNAFVDITVFGEGEHPFREILSAVAGRIRFGEIKGIAYRENGVPVLTEPADVHDLSDCPSPYQMGLLDGILEKYPEMDFSAILETNRGCPYHCAFCDWCRQESKIRSFSWERTEADIRWMAEHKIEFCYCADANFGIRGKDEDLIDYLIETKKEYGYPKKFRVNYAKLNNDTVLKKKKKLESADLNKGATISFQSMTPETLKCIGRENMPISRFSQLMERYRDAGISTYTEIILGLPGESYDEFCRGIGKLLEAGQHTTLFIYNCELIENSLMASPAYMKKYGIRSVETPLYLRHNEKKPDGGREERSRCVVCTDKMDAGDWIRANMFSVLVQSCHSMGLLRFFALYLFDALRIPYHEFYQSLQRFSAAHPETVIGGVYAEFQEYFRAIVAGHGEWSCCIPEAGTVSWPYEEAFYLRLLQQKDRFYAGIGDFIRSYGIDETLLDDILAYQRIIVKEPDHRGAEGAFRYDLVPYFSDLMRGNPSPLKKRRNQIRAFDENVPSGMEEFAKRCIWFGRSTQKNLFSDLSVQYGETI